MYETVLFVVYLEECDSIETAAVQREVVLDGEMFFCRVEEEGDAAVVGISSKWIDVKNAVPSVEMWPSDMDYGLYKRLTVGLIKS